MTMRITNNCVFILFLSSIFSQTTYGIMRFHTEATAFANRFGQHRGQKKHEETIDAQGIKTNQPVVISSAEEKFTPEMTWQEDVANTLRSELKTKRTKMDMSPLMVSLVGVPGSGSSISVAVSV